MSASHDQTELNCELLLTLANSLDDLSGAGVAIGGSVSPIPVSLVGGGLEVTQSLSGAKPIYTANVTSGIGTPVEVHAYKTETNIHSINGNSTNHSHNSSLSNINPNNGLHFIGNAPHLEEGCPIR